VPLWTGNGKQIHKIDKSSNQRGQSHNSEGTGGHDIVLQPKKVSSPSVLSWGLGISIMSWLQKRKISPVYLLT